MTNDELRIANGVTGNPDEESKSHYATPRFQHPSQEGILPPPYLTIHKNL